MKLCPKAAHEQHSLPTPCLACDPSGCVARRSLTALEDRSSIPDAGNNNVLVTRSDWPTLVGSVCYASLVSASTDRHLKHIYDHLSMSIAQPRKTKKIQTHIITGTRSCTIQVSAELLMTGCLCRSVPYMESALLHNARKTSATEVHYSQEALYQMLYTYIHIHTRTIVYRERE